MTRAATVKTVYAPKSDSWLKASAVSWIALVITMGTFIYSAGSLGQQVQTQAAEILVLRSDLKNEGALNSQILQRLSSIDTRLAIMSNTRRRKGDD